MKRLFVILLTLVMIICALSSCAQNNKDSKIKRIEELGGSDLASRADEAREKAAEQSGKRVNEKAKENEKKNNGSKSTPAPTDDKDNKSTPGQEGMAESINSSSLSGDKYSRTLKKNEFAAALKVALRYAKKTVSNTVTSKDLKTADPTSKEYDKYPLYDAGRIIIFVCTYEGKDYSIAVGRQDKNSEWKVLNKK